MPEQLSKQELEALCNITTPTIANAIEVFNIQPRNTGFMTPDIRCILPELGTMVGYAVTCTIRAELPPPLAERCHGQIGGIISPRFLNHG
jgi:hypothetical protein